MPTQKGRGEIQRAMHDVQSMAIDPMLRMDQPDAIYNLARAVKFLGELELQRLTGRLAELELRLQAAGPDAVEDKPQVRRPGFKPFRVPPPRLTDKPE